MFIGHFAAGMAAKKVNPSLSLALYFLAAQFLDLLWPTFLLLDLEHVVIAPGTSKVTPLDFTDYPISHSLLMVLCWSMLFGVVYYLIVREKSAAMLLAALVLSHWILDLVVHIPDLPLYPGDSIKVGFGLWNSMVLTILTEGLLFVTGTVLYVKAKVLSGQRVTWKFWSIILFLVVIQFMNLTGPPPPGVYAIAWAGQLQWLFIPWAWWADR